MLSNRPSSEEFTEPLTVEVLSHTPPSSPGLTGRSSTPRRSWSNRWAAAYWMPRLPPSLGLRRAQTSTSAKPWR